MAKIKEDKKKQVKKQAVVIEQPIVDRLQDIEARRTRLKALIVLGKERGYLTYAEINDHLPDIIVLDRSRKPRRRHVEIDRTCAEPPPQPAETGTEDDGQHRNDNRDALGPAPARNPAIDGGEIIADPVQARIGT